LFTLNTAKNKSPRGKPRGDFIFDSLPPLLITQIEDADALSIIYRDQNPRLHPHLPWARSYPRERKERGERLAALTGGGQAEETEGFSLIPKWVVKKVGMKAAQSPFEEMDAVLGGVGDNVEEALDEYTGTKVG
jgi:hypothetical protein